jgi:hypothetical protein
MTHEISSLGGKARGQRERNQALESYNQNPNHCLTCQSIINVKPTERVCQARKRKFCSHKCSAEYSNRHRISRRKVSTKPKRMNALDGVTKGDLFNRRKNYQSARSTIRDHAYSIFMETNTGTCHQCGYSKHIEVAHIKAVSEFTSDTLITVINAPKNLVGLCPNCHWEFDHNLLTLSLQNWE